MIVILLLAVSCTQGAPLLPTETPILPTRTLNPPTAAPTSPPTLTVTSFPSPPQAPRPAITPPPTGDWVITGNQIAENRSLILNGNLRVENGGSLTLRRVQLTINSTYDGQYGIRVKSGATITIEDGSVITATNNTGRFTFIVEPNVGFVMRDSELHGCGWGTPYESYEDTAGLVIYADNAVVERNLFSSNFNGIMLKGATGVQITANRFLANTWSGISTWGSRGAYIADNTFDDGYNGIWTSDSHDSVITGNTFSRHFEGAVFLFSGWNNEISGNSMDVDNSSYRGWVGVELDKISGNNRILNNTFVGGKNGVNVHHSPNNTIQGNTITGAEHAIAMGYADDNLIADNTLADIGSGFSYGAVLLYHSSRNQILNNRIEMVGEAPGVLLFGSSMSNTLKSNVINSSFRGLMLHDETNGNVVVGNAISAAQEEAVVVNESSGNVIHHNNFVGSQPSYDDGRNGWDDESVGNYWQNYPGTSPYSILPNGTDLYPQVTVLSVTPVPVPTLATIEIVDSPWRLPWSIAETMTVEDRTLTVEGDLIIEARGSLTLTNVTLWVGGGRAHAGITVRPGGALYVYNSTIAATEAGGGYLFRAEPDSTLVLKGSTVRGAGFSWGTDWGGIDITTDGVTIENTLITDTFRGLVIRSPASEGHRVVGNTIAGCYQGMSVSDQSSSLVADNQIEDCIGWGINVDGGSGVNVTDNRILEVWSWGGLGIFGNSHTVLRNTITSLWSRWGMNVDGEGHRIADNVISASEK